jgi:hypothetical protein
MTGTGISERIALALPGCGQGRRTLPPLLVRQRPSCASLLSPERTPLAAYLIPFETRLQYLNRFSYKDLAMALVVDHVLGPHGTADPRGVVSRDWPPSACGKLAAHQPRERGVPRL